MLLKRKGWGMGIVLGAVIVALFIWSGDLQGAFQSAPVLAAGAPATDQHVVSVNGQGEMTVDPDVAYVYFGVQTRAGTANEAQAANAKAFTEVEKVLKGNFKVDAKDVKTADFQVRPEYSYPDKEQPKITGYTTIHNVKVTFRELAKLGDLLDAVSKAGSNQVSNIQFSTEKSEEYELIALEKAMANAEAKAKVLAKAAGKELKGVIGIQQGGSSGVPIAYANYAMESVKLMSDSASTSISGGQLTISASVNVQYEF